MFGREKLLQGKFYAIFGEVVEGMDVVDKIKSKTGNKGFHQDVPTEKML